MKEEGKPTGAKSHQGKERWGELVPPGGGPDPLSSKRELLLPDCVQDRTPVLFLRLDLNGNIGSWVESLLALD